MPKETPASLFIGRWLPWCSLFVLFYYQVHKYPLGYDTGVEASNAILIGKYLIITFLLLLSSLFRFRLLQHINYFDFFWLSIFSSVAIVGGLSRSADLVECGFWALAGWGIARMSSPLSLIWTSRFCLVLLVANYFMVIVQIIGLIFFNKSFASSNPNVWLSRFSGLTVEPLSASFLGLFFIGFGVSFYGWKRIFVVASGVLFIILCQTWTGYFYLVFLGFLIIRTNSIGNSKWAIFALVAVILLLSFLLACTNFNFLELYELKKPSIELHMSYWLPTSFRLWPSYSYNFAETWWVNGIENMGFVWTLAYHAVCLYLMLIIWNKYKSYRTTDRGWIYLTTLIIGGYFLVGSLNLAYPVIYPANFMFFLFAMLCYFDKFNSSDSKR